MPPGTLIRKEIASIVENAAILGSINYHFMIANNQDSTP